MAMSAKTLAKLAKNNLAKNIPLPQGPSKQQLHDMLAEAVKNTLHRGGRPRKIKPSMPSYPVKHQEDLENE